MSESTSQQQQQQAQPGEAATSYSAQYLGAPGVRFVPSDQELIVDYLQAKLRGEDPPTNAVHVRDVYVEHPKELTRKLGDSLEGSWFVFSPRNRKYAKGKRPSRNTGDAGLWKAMGKNDDILGGPYGRTVIGQKRSLTYHELVYNFEGYKPGDRPRRQKTEWKMLEFVSGNSDRPVGAAEDSMLLNDWVLCKITTGKVVAEEKDPGSSQLQEQEQEQQQAITPDAPGGGDAAAAASALSQQEMPCFFDGIGSQFEHPSFGGFMDPHPWDGADCQFGGHVDLPPWDGAGCQFGGPVDRSPWGGPADRIPDPWVDDVFLSSMLSSGFDGGHDGETSDPEKPQEIAKKSSLPASAYY